VLIPPGHGSDRVSCSAGRFGAKQMGHLSSAQLEALGALLVVVVALMWMWILLRRGR
jgi:hypothetical protein